MLNIQISGNSIQLLKEFPDNGDQFNLLIEGVEITIWDRPQVRDALLPVIEVHPGYHCHTSGGTLHNYAAAQYFKSLRLKGTDPDAAWLAAKGYEDDLVNLSKVDDELYETVTCPDDCSCHTEAPPDGSDLTEEEWDRRERGYLTF